MSISQTHLNLIKDMFTGDQVQYVIDEVTSSQWYIGVSKFKTLKSEAGWIIFEIANTGTTIDIRSATQAFNKIWNDRASLAYIRIDNVSLDITEFSDAEAIDTTIGNITSNGGAAPITYTIQDDVENIFKIVNNDELQLIYTAVNASYTFTIRATDNEGDFFDQEFTLTVTTFEDTKSINFDSVDAYLDGGDIILYDHDDPFTISLWVKPDNVSLERNLMEKGSAVGWWFNHSSTGALKMRMFSAIETRSHTFNKTLTAGVWQHVVFTYSGNSNLSGWKCYLDDSVAGAPSNGPMTSTILGGYNLKVGVRAGAKFFAGNMSEISIWDKELSAAEVTAIYNAGAPAALTAHSAEPNLVMWCRADGSTYPTIDDSRGTNDLTMINMVSGDLELDVP